MRLQRLELDGFGSYGEPTVIDFADLEALAIVGPNGAGKTTIVEAISWALYGKGRSREMDGYVSTLDRTDCRVALEFTLGSGRYRVERQRSLSAGGRSNLTLAVQAEVGWEAITGAIIAETQAAIERLLGLSYDAWVASSYVAQGRADAFTVLGPADRKRLLFELLELDSYERLHELATARERGEALRQVGLQRRLEDLEDVLAARDGAQERLASATLDRVAIAARIAQVEEELEATRARLQEAVAGIARFERIQEELDAAQARRLAEVGRIGEEVRRAEAEESELRGTAADVGARLEELSHIRDMLPALEEGREASRVEAAQKDQEAQEVLGRVELLTGRAAAQLESARTATERLPELREAIALLGRSGEPRCPTCQQSLREEQREMLLQSYEALERRLVTEATAQQQAAQEATDDAQRLREEAVRLKERGRAVWFEGTESDRAIERALAAGERIPEEEARLRELEQKIQILENLRRDGEARIQALGRLSPDEERLEPLLDEARELESRAAATRERADSLHHDLEYERANLAVAIAEQARAEEAVGSITRARTEIETVQAEHAEVLSRRFGYAALARIFGRDGIPALILDAVAIPAINEEANRLLERLTGGRLSVRIESLRALKGGGLKETLDVTVADASSERPLETFSGGERQAVDLALRIALARLVAQRAGRPMEVLILDEAFTAFDEERRQATVEVLHQIREEFPQLLFITHLVDLAAAFPTRLEISGGQGTEPSRVSVVGRIGVAA